MTSIIAAVCCVILVCSKVINGCTSGFMDLDLLRKRAEKITNGGTNDDSLDNNFILLPGDSFSYSGTMTGLLLVGAVRTGGGRNQYPEIQIYRNTGGNTYTRQGSSQEIRLYEGDFSPDGVLQYNLTTPISFQNGDVLGMYQPANGDSVVRVYYRQAAVTTYRNSDSPMSSINLNDLSTVTDQEILISPISNSPSCTGNFLSRSALRQGALDININDVTRISDRQRLFPDITFTCNGSITKWIVGGTTDSMEMKQPELQIWRNTGGTSYTKAKFSLLPFSTLVSNVAEYTLSTPLEFQEGDILGVYQPQVSKSAFVVYYQERDGPVIYQEGMNSLSTVTLGSPNYQYDYPLVTVEISTAAIMTPSSATKTVMIAPTITENKPATSSASITVTHAAASSASPNHTTSILSLLTTSAVVDKHSASPSQDTVNIQFYPTSNILSETVTPAASTTALMQENTIIFAATVPAVLIVLLVTITIVIIVVLVIAFIWRRNYKSSHIVQHPVGTSAERVELQNVYCTMPSFKDKQQQQMNDYVEVIDIKQGDRPTLVSEQSMY